VSDLFSTPWPIYVNECFIDGAKYTAPQACRSCSSKECLSSTDSPFLCSNGLESRSNTIGEMLLVVIGIDNKKKPKRFKGVNFSPKAYSQWLSKVSSLNEYFEIETFKIKSETLHYFHDPVKWAEQIRINSGKIIDGIDGADFKEKFEKASGEQKAIYQSSKMLVDSIRMIDVFFNPDSASYGRTVKTNIYKLFDKVQSIIYFSEGKKYNKRFILGGSSFKEVFVYESFSIIPLTLIHNALKYSKTREVEIEIDDASDGVFVKVVSIGPIIKEEEKSKIFEKGYRGKYASRLHHDGAGMGLHVAKHVANVHGFTIGVTSNPLGYDDDKMSMAENIFSFTVPSNGT
jgi:hypothetical protein